MAFSQNRLMITGAWQRISMTDDANVTVESYGVNAYQRIEIGTGTADDPPAAGTSFRTLSPQRQLTYTNLDEGTVLWARSSGDPVPVDITTG